MDKNELIIKLIKDSGYPSIKAFAEKCGMPYTTLHSMLKRGISKASVDNVILVCRNLGITVEELENLSSDRSISKNTDANDLNKLPRNIRAAARNMANLPKEKQQTAIEMINFLSKKGEEAKNNESS